MTTNATNRPTGVRKALARIGRIRLRDRLFLASALISTTILLLAAWVINNQVVRQARQQVQSEVEGLLPVYNSVWEENARSLATLGMTMANSPNVKIIFGDARAARDRQTIREMIADFGGDLAARVDLVLITDGAGRITFEDLRGREETAVSQLAAARDVAESQRQQQCFAILGGRLFQLSLTPVLLQSGSDEYQNTLAVLGVGLELNRAVAQEMSRRIHCDVVFLAADRIYASSLDPAAEAGLAQLVASPEISRAEAARPVEVRTGDHLNLTFSRQLEGTGGQRVGQVVVLRSLADAGRLFRTISNVLLLLWTLSIAAAFALSYLIARRITRPMEELVKGTRELGSGNYDFEIRAEARGELGELAGAFDQMRRSLRQTQAELLKRERLATIGRMAGSIIHDLRNPLATISTAAEMLARDNLPSERRRTLLESQLRASQRMHEMLRELLDFTHGNYSLSPERQALRQIIERAVQEVSTLAARTGVLVEVNVASDLMVKADAGQLRRVFENLLTNAIQAMPGGGTVRVQAARQHSEVRIDVIDSGPGVAAEIRERLFEPFVSHGKLGGTGLGLAIAQSITEAHGGTLRLEATTAGADFYLTLPLDEGGPHADPDTAG
ncbi:MAG TPA: HAMP domain-containing sensor histidine kinase [Blastocatellia bacterium]|nr:HAMP domain-containing sensor histidine kinase [Blastocatellia bacterium]